MVSERCGAKNPATCRYHGGQKLGVQAETYIKDALAHKPARYYLTDEQLDTVPLKKMSATALALSLQQTARREPTLDADKVDQAVLLAAHLHRKDLRANRGRYAKTPYIEHPLRNTVRLVRMGCTDQATLVASILHDTVEDHPFEFPREPGEEKAKDEQVARERAYRYIAKTYGTEVETLVRGMSNDLIDKDAPATTKNEAYRAHVAHAIENPKVCATKLADLIDNAVGLYHNTPDAMGSAGIARRATKYLLVWDDVEARLKRDVFERRIPISDAGLKEAITQFERGRKRLTDLAALHTA